MNYNSKLDHALKSAGPYLINHWLEENYFKILLRKSIMN
jgi:hypothetical protein